MDRINVELRLAAIQEYINKQCPENLGLDEWNWYVTRLSITWLGEEGHRAVKLDTESQFETKVLENLIAMHKENPEECLKAHFGVLVFPHSRMTIHRPYRSLPRVE
jgi:hypothetical protein